MIMRMFDDGDDHFFMEPPQPSNDEILNDQQLASALQFHSLSKGRKLRFEGSQMAINDQKMVLSGKKAIAKVLQQSSRQPPYRG